MCKPLLETWQALDEQEGLDQALLGHRKSHIDVIDTTQFLREEFMTYGLHLNL
jgi:hypothetical protein